MMVCIGGRGGDCSIPVEMNVVVSSCEAAVVATVGGDNNRISSTWSSCGGEDVVVADSSESDSL